MNTFVAFVVIFNLLLLVVIARRLATAKFPIQSELNRGPYVLNMMLTGCIATWGVFLLLGANG